MSIDTSPCPGRSATWAESPSASIRSAAVLRKRCVVTSGTRGRGGLTGATAAGVIRPHRKPSDGDPLACEIRELCFFEEETVAYVR